MKRVQRKDPQIDSEKLLRIPPTALLSQDRRTTILAASEAGLFKLDTSFLHNGTILCAAGGHII